MLSDESTARSGRWRVLVAGLLLVAVSFLVGLLGWSAAVLAQSAPAQTADLPRIGLLASYSTAVFADSRERLTAALAEIGLVDRRDIEILVRTDDVLGRLRAHADDLVQQGVRVIVTFATPAAHAAKAATDRVPIVLAGIADPVATGLVSNLQRPGGNVTGFSNMMPELAGKRLEVLRDMVPHLARVAFLSQPADPAARSFVAQAVDAGRRLGVTVFEVPVPDAASIDGALDAVAAGRADAVIVQPLIAIEHRGEFAARVAARGLASISDLPGYASDGGLLAYGPDSRAVGGRPLAVVIDRILKGADPATMPVQLPTRFTLSVNLATAARLGLTVPPAIVARADTVIE